MRPIPTQVHGILDYLVGVLLIVAPWVLGFANSGPATWVPVTMGALVIIYSLMTRYELGIVPVFTMPVHLWLDGLGGLFLGLSPWIFGFADYVWLPHVIVGVVEIVVAVLTRTVPTGRAAAEHRRAARRPGDVPPAGPRATGPGPRAPSGEPTREP